MKEKLLDKLLKSAIFACLFAPAISYADDLSYSNTISYESGYNKDSYQFNKDKIENLSLGREYSISENINFAPNVKIGKYNAEYDGGKEKAFQYGLSADLTYKMLDDLKVGLSSSYMIANFESEKLKYVNISAIAEYNVYNGVSLGIKYGKNINESAKSTKAASFYVKYNF